MSLGEAIDRQGRRQIKPAGVVVIGH